MGDVRNKFIAPLAQVFTLPKADDFDLFVGAYEELLSTFSDEALALAAKQIIGSRTTRSFPLPAECNHACRDAIASMAAQDRRRPDNTAEIRNGPLEHRHPEWSEKHLKRTDELFAACSFARASVEEHWSWSLWTWIQNNGRIPDVHEAAKIRSSGIIKSKAIEDAVENCEGLTVVMPFGRMLRQTYDKLRQIAS